MAQTILTIVALALGGCSREEPPPAAPPDAGVAAVTPAPWPMTVVDDLGAKVVLPRRPARIVSLQPGVTETVCALGACGQLVAVDDYSNWPAEVAGVPRVGALLQLDVEAIVATHPDVVFASLYTKGVDQMRGMGLSVVQLALEDYDDVFESMEAVGRMLGRGGSADAVAAALRGRIEALEARARAAGDAPTVYYEIDATPYSVGPDSFVGTLLTKAGGRNIVPAELGRFPRVSPELVLSADPDVILLTVGGSGEGYGEGEGAKTLKARPGWASLKALREGRVCELSPSEADRIVRAGPRVDEGLAILLRCIHGGA